MGIRLLRLLAGIVFICGLPLWVVISLTLWVTTGNSHMEDLMDWIFIGDDYYD